MSAAQERFSTRSRRGGVIVKKLQVFSIGEVLWDLFPDGERFGGAPANFAWESSQRDAVKRSQR